jgi:threonyl-tRNA synthetase
MEVSFAPNEHGYYALLKQDAISMAGIIALQPLALHQQSLVCELKISTHEHLKSTFIFLLGYALQQTFPHGYNVAGGYHDLYGFYYDIAITPLLDKQALELLTAAMPAVINAFYDQAHFKFVARAEAMTLFHASTNHLKIIEQSLQDRFLICFMDNNYYDLMEHGLVMQREALTHFVWSDVSSVQNEEKQALTRIYGQCFYSQEELTQHLTSLQQAAAYCHRDLGRRLDLFHFQKEAPGMAFWHAKGVIFWQVLEQHIRASNAQYHYQEVKTPILAKQLLWEKSGHSDQYAQNIFCTHVAEEQYFIKPMSCPLHIQIFNEMHVSYKALPLRLFEFGLVHRNESSGSLNGLFRSRSFVQDDAHIFCQEEQLFEEITSLMQQAFTIYYDFGFLKENITVKLSLRPDERIGDDASWDRVEQQLQNAISSLGIDFLILQKEGAFYGPKIEFHLKDVLGRSWQCGTIQVDFFIPGRLDCTYVNEHNNKQHPILIHRAFLGSLERFTGILLEHYLGKLPVWLAPVQIILCAITSEHEQYTNMISQQLSQHGIRTGLDLRRESLSNKIRMAKGQKIPFIGIIGSQECQQATVSVRCPLNNKIVTLNLQDLVTFIQNSQWR